MEKYINKYRAEDGLLVYYISATSCCGKYVEWRRGEAPDVCPFCGNKYWRKPNLEMRLFTLQDEFIDDYNKTGSTRILGEKMFPYIREYAENLIKALLVGRKSLDNEELKARAWDAATMLIEVIMSENDHRMHYSFGAYLGRLCKSVCYITKNHDKTYSLNSILPDGKTELGDRITINLNELSGGKEYGYDSMSNITEMKEPSNDTIDELVRAVQLSANKVNAESKNHSYKLLYLMGLLLVFRKEEKSLKVFCSGIGNEVSLFVNKGEQAVRTLFEEANAT